MHQRCPEYPCTVAQAALYHGYACHSSCGIERHRNVPVPGRRDVVDVKIELGQIFEIRFIFAEALGLRLSCVRYHLLRVCNLCRHEIADGLDLYVFYGEQSPLLQPLVPCPRPFGTIPNPHPLLQASKGGRLIIVDFCNYPGAARESEFKISFE